MLRHVPTCASEYDEIEGLMKRQCCLFAQLKAVNESACSYPHLCILFLINLLEFTWPLNSRCADTACAHIHRFSISIGGIFFKHFSLLIFSGWKTQRKQWVLTTQSVTCLQNFIKWIFSAQTEAFRHSWTNIREKTWKEENQTLPRTHIYT